MTYGYPPQGTPGHGYAPTPPQQPKKMSTGKKIALFGCLPATLLGLLVMGGCAVLAGSAVNEAGKAIESQAAGDKRAAKEDADITSCKLVTEEFIGKQLNAEVKITNHGKERANYIVEGEYVDKNGDKIGELYAIVSNLAPGKSATEKDFGAGILPNALADVDKGECKIVKVTRDDFFAAED